MHFFEFQEKGGQKYCNRVNLYMTLPECMTLPEIWPTTIFSVKLMHLCIFKMSFN